MMSAWWLFLIIPVSVFLGFMGFVGWLIFLDWRDAHDSNKKRRL